MASNENLRQNQINAVNSGAESWTGIGVVAGFCTVVLIMQWPHKRKGEMTWRSALLQRLQEVRTICKTRNQLYMSHCLHLRPSDLCLEHLDAPIVMDFLAYLEAERGNSPSTRNTRLAAITSFMRFVEYRVPAILEQSRRVLAIPTKKTALLLIRHLSMTEMQALLDAPDVHSHPGIRDRAMLHLCFAAGLRVSELLTLPLTAVTFHPTPAVRVLGKGRRERSLPLWKQVADDLRGWLGVRGDVNAPELFLSAQGRVMTREGFAYILRKYVRMAAQRCPALAAKHVTPHVLLHTCAMMVLQATGDLRKISLWLGPCGYTNHGSLSLRRSHGQAGSN